MLMLGSCTGKSGGEAGASDADSTAICSYDIVGDWAIERIVAGDTLSLTPSKQIAAFRRPSLSVKTETMA